MSGVEELLMGNLSSLLALFAAPRPLGLLGWPAET